MKEQEITRYLHSRYGMMLMMAFAVIGTVLAYYDGDIVYITGNNGFGLPSANEWISDRFVSLCAGLLLNVSLAVLLSYMNRRFNVLRSMSHLFVGMFMIMQGGLPSIMGQVYDGTVMCAILLLAIIPLFSTFQNPELTRRIFLTFFLVSMGSLTGYAYAIYIVACIVGCIQMRSFTMRGMMAAAIGVVTPYWILWGFGVISPSNFTLPEFVSLFNALEGRELAQIIVYTGFTLFLGFGFGTLNLVRIYRYNARTRAYNGFWLVVSVITVIFIFVDYNNLIIYLPILNCCSALQIGHFFRINNQLRSYIPILCIIGAYTALYIWSIAI